MVRAFRSGQSLRAVAERFAVSVSFVRRWVQRAG
ncbi:MAG: helix-turn-helix domain-containing protein [Planctomycetaceae bacterium]|nr:helix-turn-helix domain-containing protein [Planctomycetaceae bacterium]